MGNIMNLHDREYDVHVYDFSASNTPPATKHDSVVGYDTSLVGAKIWEYQSRASATIDKRGKWKIWS